MLFSASIDDLEPGRWRFVLRALDGSDRLVAEDMEPDVHGERLELLALVRGLEALAQPSRVTLFTPSRYIRTGIRSGLPEWRRNGWRWEYFGQMVPVKNCDLWQRVDRALRFHELECRSLRVDAAHEPYPVRSAAKDRTESVRQGGGRDLEASPRPPERAETAGRSCSESRLGSFSSANRPAGRGLSWRSELGLGKLFGLVKLLTGNRPGTLSPVVVCKEV
jgi:ribonuclease HI